MGLENPSELADKLDVLQREENDGRGVSCVQTIIVYLRIGEVRLAKNVCWNEAGKIALYPDIKEVIRTELYSGDEDLDIPPHFQSREHNERKRKKLWSDH